MYEVSRPEEAMDERMVKPALEKCVRRGQEKEGSHLHVIANHAAESHFALFADPMSCESNIVANTPYRLVDERWIGCMKGWRDGLCTAC